MAATQELRQPFSTVDKTKDFIVTADCGCVVTFHVAYAHFQASIMPCENHDADDQYRARAEALAQARLIRDLEFSCPTAPR